MKNKKTRSEATLLRKIESKHQSSRRHDERVFKKITVLLIAALLTIFLLAAGYVAYDQYREAQLDEADKQRFETARHSINVVRKKLSNDSDPSANWNVEESCSRANSTFGPGDPSCGVTITSSRKLARAENTRKIIDKNYQIIENSGQFIRIPSNSSQYPDFKTDSSVREYDDNALDKYGSRSYAVLNNNIKCYTDHKIEYIKGYSQQITLKSVFRCADKAREAWFPRDDCRGYEIREGVCK